MRGSVGGLRMAAQEGGASPAPTKVRELVLEKWS
jgi:hypothetical protein